MTLQTSDSIVNLAKALVDTQRELKQPFKDANNPAFKSQYVPLESVTESITKTATKYGLAFSQFATTDAEQNVSITTVIFHESGEFIQYPALTLKPSKQRVVIDTEYVNGKRVNIYSNEITPQSIGSCITYGKRYSLSAIFGITSDKDDDGNEASGVTHNGQQQPTPEKIFEDGQKRCEDIIASMVKLGAERQKIVDYVCEKYNVGNLYDVPMNKLIGELKVLQLKQQEKAEKQPKQEEGNEEW
jgi:hypothetical protein|nr:MAG TPA: ERF superfamily protein [Caudoviricetes sp.]